MAVVIAPDFGLIASLAMETSKDSLIVQKTQALCQTLVEQPGFADLKSKLDAFMSDEGLKFHYQQVNDLGGLLQAKQGEGLELKEEEIQQFETMREELLANPVARGFLEARDEVQKVHQLIGSYLEKTFELGRRPEHDDFHSGCGDCGCH